MNDLAIAVDGLNKVYRIYERPRDRLDEAIFHRKKHRDFFALRDISFSVPRGMCMGIIGVNGSGKSTLLKIITGILSPSSGSVKTDGRVSALLELGAGFNGEYTGIENIYLNGSIMGYTKREMDERLPGILDFADIGDFAHQAVKTYSSGMFVRLAFAVAINVDPDILIIDEALAVGDMYFQAKCYRQFSELKQKGKTILFVSHSMDSILKYCDSTLLLDAGRLVGQGDGKSMIDAYKQIATNCWNSDQHLDGKIISTAPSANPHLIEYGDRRAEIIEYALYDRNGSPINHITQGELMEIGMTVRVNERLPELLFAYTIKDLKGSEICGTNTMYERLAIDERTGTYSVRFRQKCDLAGGSYLVSLGVTSYQGTVVHHRLYDAIGFEVVSHKLCSGVWNPSVEISVWSVGAEHGTIQRASPGAR